MENKFNKIIKLSESLTKIYNDLRTDIAYADDATKSALCIEGANYVISQLNRYMVTVEDSAKEAIFKAFTENDFGPGVDAFWAKTLGKGVYYGEDSRGVYITIQTSRGWSGGRLRKEHGDAKYYVPGLSLTTGQEYINDDGYEDVEIIITTA